CCGGLFVVCYPRLSSSIVAHRIQAVSMSLPLLVTRRRYSRCPCTITSSLPLPKSSLLVTRRAPAGADAQFPPWLDACGVAPFGMPGGGGLGHMRGNDNGS